MSELPSKEIVARSLEGELEPGASLAGMNAVLLRNVPGKRAAFALELTIHHAGRSERRRVLAKVYSRNQGACAYDVLRDLSRRGFGDGAWRVPKPLGYDPESRTLLLEWIDGLKSVEAVERAAAWLAAIHRSGTAAGRPYTFERQLHTLRGWAARIAQVCPAARPRLTDLLNRIEKRAASVNSWTPGPTHRDFSPDHVLINDGITTGLDFDEFCQYDPLFDVAHFMARLRSAQNCDALADRFLSAYRALAPEYSERRIALHTSVSYFKLAHITATITRPPDWEHRLDGLLDAAGCGKETPC
jgi:hypothetical protein